MTYNWIAALAFLALAVLFTKLGKFIAFRIPALARMRAINLEQDAIKYKKAKYPPMIKSSEKVGLVLNLLFLLLIAPFSLTLDAPQLWQLPVHIIGSLMLYDFFYYLTHRFLFHGDSFFRQIHAIHHQARNPTRIDALYVHPVETAMGLGLFLLTLGFIALISGPMNIVVMAFVYTWYTQQNVFNHTHFDLPYAPYRTLDYLTSKHHIHHINMQKGNYASITPLYDFMFGTLD